VASDIRRGVAWFAGMLGAASLLRLALEPRYWGGFYLAWLMLLLAYAFLMRRILSRADPARVRLALLANFVAIGVGYAMIGAALGSAPGWRADDALYRIECALFGRDPQQFLSPLRGPWVSTAAALGYVSFVVFLTYLFLAEAFRLTRATGRLQLELMRLYGIGYSCYILFPAAGPAFHHPSMLAPVAHSPVSAYLCAWVTRCCSQVDVWPSLHAAVCCFALIWSCRLHRRAFLLLIVPGVALMAGAVYLQYHYFIDMMAGCVLGVACILPLPRADLAPITPETRANRPEHDPGLGQHEFPPNSTRPRTTGPRGQRSRQGMKCVTLGRTPR
jgi:hypothetical protein